MTAPIPAFVTMPVAVICLPLVSVYHLYKLALRRQAPSLIAATSPVFALAQVFRETVPVSGDSPLFLLLAAAFGLAGVLTIFFYEEARPYPWR